MTRARINRFAAIVPLIFSTIAFAVVINNILAGTPPQPDENASAHVWQILIAGQLPIIMLFLTTADWRRRSTALLFGAQLFGLALACAPVWLAGY